MKPLFAVLGPPGGGKSTIAAKLCRENKWMHISTGDLLRRIAREETELGRTVRQCIAGAVPVSDDVAVAMVTDILRKHSDYRGFFLDGFPRTLPQAHALDRSLTAAGTQLTQVFFMRVTHAEAVRRLSMRRVCADCHLTYAVHDGIERCTSCGRLVEQRAGDIDEPTLRKRRQTFFDDTGPVLECYRERRLLTEVEALQPMEHNLHELGKWMSAVEGVA